MASVVFLRAVNLGGNTLRTKVLADELGLVNVGAAGTFVARGRVSRTTLEASIRRRLPFETAIMICPDDEILGLIRDEPFAKRSPPQGIQRFVSVLEEAPKARPSLPIDRPEGKGWEVRVERIVGRYALSLRKAGLTGRFYPNEVIEKTLGIAATTRGWNTLVTVQKILEGL